MTTQLDLHDIQGNIVKGYGRYGFPKSRYVFYNINQTDKARKFLRDLIPLLTTSYPWGKTETGEQNMAMPPATTNIAFTYSGLKHIGVPRESLQSFPQAFAMGMAARADILGDDGPSAPKNWDPIWCTGKAVHLWISINGTTEGHIEDRYHEITALVGQSDGAIKQLEGHRGADGAENLPYQKGSAIYVNDVPTPKEHFGYTDGISNPYFEGSSTNPANVIGGGKLTGEDPTTAAGWAPLETGEFILGHRDEAYEYPAAPQPPLLARNGTYMVYRKLHENVGSYNGYLDNVGRDVEGGKEALAAKFAGRWRNGAPLTTFGTEDEATEFVEQLRSAKVEAGKSNNPLAQAKYLELRQKFVAFNYDKDLAGSRCPVGAHMRRANPRGALEFGVKGAYATPGALINRRRILRRGLPYGEVKDPNSDSGNHGIVFMALNADIERQFEFVQQQWIIYGNDMKLSNDKDPILGNHSLDKHGAGDGRMVFPAEPDSDKAPFFCTRIPRLVETRGGDYFFIPSMTALRMLGEGIVDRT